MECLMPTFFRICVTVALAGCVVMSLSAQQPPSRPRGIPKPPDPGPLFFSENWRNPKTYDANTLPLTSVTPELWGGSCGAVTVTLRHKNNFVDLSNRGRVIWGTYVSGFHVARLVVKLADGTFLVGDPGTGQPDVSHVESEIVLSSLRW